MIKRGGLLRIFDFIDLSRNQWEISMLRVLRPRIICLTLEFLNIQSKVSVFFDRSSGGSQLLLKWVAKFPQWAFTGWLWGWCRYLCLSSPKDKWPEFCASNLGTPTEGAASHCPKFCPAASRRDTLPICLSWWLRVPRCVVVPERPLEPYLA